MADHRLAIGRLRAEYWLPCNHPGPDAARAAFDAALDRRLQEAGARWLDKLCPSHDERVWFVPSLELDFTLPAHTAADDLPAAFARHFARALANLLEQPPANVRTFPNPLALVIAFVTDVLAGRAWEHEHYTDFDGLRLLPPGTAAAEALLRAPDQVLDGLTQLARQVQLERLLETAPPRDLNRLAHACAHAEPARTPTDPRPVVEILLDVWPHARIPNPSDPAQLNANLLRLVVAARQHHPTTPAATLLAVARELLQLAASPLAPTADTLPEPPPAPSPRLDAPPLPANTSGPEPFEAIAQTDSAWRHRVETRLAQLTGLRPGAPAPSSAHFLTSDYAGLILLLRSLVESGLADALDHLKPIAAPALNPHAALRAWILQLALAPCPGTCPLDSDPVFLTLTGADSPLPTELDVARAFGPPATTELLRQLNVVLLESETLPAEHLTLELLPDLVPEEPIVLVRHVPRNAWLWLGPASSNPAADIPALATLFRRAPTAAPAPDDVRIEIAQLGTLDTRPDARDTLHFQLTLRLLARALLRDLARRLPGFANSRPAFLRENVLRGPLRLERCPDGWQAHLGPVPLQVLLAMTGLDGACFHLPWLPDSPAIETLLAHD